MHTSTAKQRFQKFPPWRCVFGEHFHRIDGWTAGQTGRKVSLFKQKRIRVDQRPNRKEKSTFSNKNGSVWTKDQTEGKNLPLKTKTDTCGRKTKPEEKIPFSNKHGYVWTKDQSGGTNLPFQTKTDTCGCKTKQEGKISLFKQKHGYLWTGPKLHLSTNYEFIHHDPIYSMVQMMLTFSTKFSRLPPAFRASIPIVIFLFFP